MYYVSKYMAKPTDDDGDDQPNQTDDESDDMTKRNYVPQHMDRQRKLRERMRCECGQPRRHDGSGVWTCTACGSQVTPPKALPNDDNPDDQPEGTDDDVLMGLSMCHICPGRFWGVWGAANMPWAKRVIFTCVVAAGALESACECLQSTWATHERGWTLFDDDAGGLQRLLTGELLAWEFANEVARSHHADMWHDHEQARREAQRRLPTHAAIWDAYTDV